jgi:hypothetical protein
MLTLKSTFVASRVKIKSTFIKSNVFLTRLSLIWWLSV